MKRLLCFAVVFALGVAAVSAAQKSAAPPKKAEELAKAVTTVTGVAISPLLGVSAVGAYEWFRADTPEEKARLPWYAQVHFWLPALLLVGAVAFKDAAGTAVPPGLKKPLDVAETIENKVSGLVAAGAFVPMVASVFSFASDGGTQALGSGPVMLAGVATFSFAGLLNIITVPLALTAFVLVWLVGHAINVLILLSPWGVVDAALKSFRTFLLGLVTVTHFINPWAGLVLSLIIILLAYLLAGWSFRLTTCGTIYVWDFITGRKHRFSPKPDGNWMFTGRKLNKVPVRTYGRLLRAPNGELNFVYRRWLFFGKPQTLVLPAGQYAVGRGAIYSEVLLVEGEKEKTMLSLPPRYRTHEEELARVYGLLGVRPIGLRKMWRWLKSLFSGSEPATATA